MRSGHTQVSILETQSPKVSLLSNPGKKDMASSPHRPLCQGTPRQERVDTPEHMHKKNQEGDCGSGEWFLLRPWWAAEAKKLKDDSRS